jgi:hypothetical protein
MLSAIKGPAYYPGGTAIAKSAPAAAASLASWIDSRVLAALMPATIGTAPKLISSRAE